MYKLRFKCSELTTWAVRSTKSQGAEIFQVIFLVHQYASANRAWYMSTLTFLSQEVDDTWISTWEDCQFFAEIRFLLNSTTSEDYVEFESLLIPLLLRSCLNNKANKAFVLILWLLVFRIKSQINNLSDEESDYVTIPLAGIVFDPSMKSLKLLIIIRS